MFEKEMRELLKTYEDQIEFNKDALEGFMHMAMPTFSRMVSVYEENQELRSKANCLEYKIQEAFGCDECDEEDDE